ncbi:MAG: T9SS type A sorting domain-containing protein [Bacteroidales bacterium]|jgi:hypothetical protein|nr:T9SS type A sorting domain-containing protein [Bacteroidales bacterium]
MNRIITLLIGGLCLGFNGFSQITLTYDKHALKAGDIQIMLKAEFVDAGPSGIKQVWNFSDLKIYGKEENFMIDATQVPKYGVLPSANVALSTGSDFHGMYRITPTENDYVGYFGKDYHVIFSQPHRRMIYPFTYGNLYMSNFSGYGIYPEDASTDISGDFSFEADAYGSLILPNDVLNNVLRVKTTYSKYEFARCFFSETHQTKYLYYTDQQRYPVFATLETMWVNFKGDTTWHRSSAVNQKVYNTPSVSESAPSPAVFAERKEYVHSVFPNPFKNEFRVNFVLDETTHVAVELYTMDGVKVSDICTKRQLNQGQHEFDYNAQALPSSTYFVKFIFNDHAFVKQLVKLK